jgi:hypothetical protein
MSQKYLKLQTTYHSDHLGGQIDDRPYAWVDSQENEPTEYTAPRRDMRELQQQQ